MVDRTFYESLPAKRMAAGAIFVNEADQVLLVKPTYKAGWEIPGGVIEKDESPRAGCEREIQEELGLSMQANQLLLVDYTSYPADSPKTEVVIFLFDGGILSDAAIAQIRLPQDELSEWRFFDVDALPATLNPILGRRIRAAYGQRQHAAAIYTEHRADS